MAELVDWMRHESVTRAGTNTATGYIPPVKKTNADKIRSMTDEELAEMLCSGICDYCKRHENGCDILEWLKKEVGDD